MSLGLLASIIRYLKELGYSLFVVGSNSRAQNKYIAMSKKH